MHDQERSHRGGDDDPDAEPVRDGGAHGATGDELAESTRVRYRAVRAVGLAALNALSEPHIPWRRGDPFESLGGDLDAVATVGHFREALKRFGARDVRVVEREAIHPETVNAPCEVQVRTFTPDQAAKAFEGVDAIFITGSTLVYGGLETYLRAATEVPIVVLVGATASFVPEPVFDAGVTTLAGARVTDLAAVRAAVERGACGSELHDSGLEKVFVERES